MSHVIVLIGINDIGMVREYQAVESTFTARAADNEVYVLDMRRRVAESIFKFAVVGTFNSKGIASSPNLLLQT